MKIFYISLVFLLTSCGLKEQPSQLQFFELEQGALNKYVNSYSMPDAPNLTVDKSIYNNDYPIELAVYQDGKFYYNLPTLGEGVGTWKEVEGRLELFARRSLFDMFIEVHPDDKDAKNIKIKFSDRFGPKILEMGSLNVQKD